MTLTATEQEFAVTLLRRDYDELYRGYHAVRDSRSHSAIRRTIRAVHAMEVNRRLQEKILGHPVDSGRPGGPLVPRLDSLREPEFGVR